jgi:hypothetical protein
MMTVSIFTPAAATLRREAAAPAHVVKITSLPLKVSRMAFLTGKPSFVLSRSLAAMVYLQCRTI